MRENVSPEEKLLSIIKGKRNIPGNAVPGPDIKDIKLIARAPWGKIDDYISTALKNDFLKNSILDARGIKVFNKYAVIIAALIAGYIILDIIFVSPSRKAALLLAKVSVSKPLVGSAEKTMPVEAKGYSYYSNRMSGRNIFAGSSNIQAESQASGAEQSADNLGLVGIIQGESPQAIVEDKKNQKTYYLASGQSTNGITVENISEGKVMLEYRGKKMTLFL